jgi:hypothetical protein
MIVPKKVLRKWKEHSKDVTYVDVAAGAELHFNTVKNAIKKGVCERSTFDKLNAYFLRKIQEDRNLEQKIVSDFEKIENDQC